MIVRDSAISLQASHSYREELVRSESFQFWVGERPARPAPASQPEAVAANDRVSLSAEAMAISAANRQPTVAPSQAVAAPEIEEDQGSGLDPKFAAMKRILEALTGRKIDISGMREAGSAGQSPDAPESASGNEADAPERAGWGMTYDFSETYTEQETTTVNASGVLLTADGREISFETGLVMSRTYVEQNELHIRAGDAVFTDPLVINFDGVAADFESDLYLFDLNADGSDEKLSRLAGGSGYLALDLNGDGEVNNGRELFGPRTGNGFSELKEYDWDKNGWIDENDPVFDLLRVWMQEPASPGKLYTLDEKRVGAILLDSIGSEFAVKDGKTPLAMIQETGLFFHENGQPGTVQRIDLAA